MILKDYENLFGCKKPIIGMIHLAGENSNDILKRALLEMDVYAKCGVRGVIIENYHGTTKNVVDVLRASQSKNLDLVKGVNILGDSYNGFELASEFGCKFVQFDGVIGNVLDLGQYIQLRNTFPKIAVLGGVRFKYQRSTGNSLEDDIREGKSHCDAIVTTGDGTGIETPLDKLVDFRKVIGKNFPLIVGAGVNADNCYDQLKICDGAIIGSAFKSEGNTDNPVEEKRVRNLVSIIEFVRERNK